MNPNIEDLRKDFSKLLDPMEPLDSRMRELYRLKETYLKTSAGATVLLEAIDTTDSVLLQHELAYNIGQSGLEETVGPLGKIVSDRKYDDVTRHEAAESLGAIGSPKAIQILEYYADSQNEPNVAVRETCELALARIATRMKEGDEALQPPEGCPFVSVDPSPAFTERRNTVDGKPAPQSVEELTNLLLNTSGSSSLYMRYMAMFTLRNLATAEAVDALCRALREDTASTLFRHEVAFVLGQMEDPRSQPALIEALEDESEAPMVRHEAAEAIGAIADPVSLSVLEAYAEHSEPIVRDSCTVALEMHKYWSNFKKHGQDVINAAE
ncbi:unnamed protein product [Phytomonas sp. Hart1]|nr:unnamed protein product [Phytomonas sp. Hart1]|eukprot:CCW70713.1 unnamed protein product [Phytomonas sp. isolate Hart1]